jgi:tRNA threonylcarbamoyladenosine biosynthesis protein TsaB
VSARDGAASDEPLTLAIDASTYAGSACVLRGDRVLAEATTAMRGVDEERLLPAIDDALRDAGVAVAEVRRVVCGAGPGSFTSLRIAASIAKGVAQGRGVPLFAVSSLALIVAGGIAPPAAGEYLAALDALRGESYVARCVVDDRGLVVRIGETRLVPTDTLGAAGTRVVGPAWPGEALPHARGVARLGASIGDPVDLASWEPAYGRLAEAQVKWEAAHGRPLPRG